ncbi:MAG: (Fe-S)-binding protein [Promethearchaeota archaeon]
MTIIKKKTHISQKTILGLILTIFTISFLIGIALGNDNFIGYDFISFQGDSHAGCHGGTDHSITGIIQVNSLEGTIIEPDTEFTIEVEIKSFTEASNEDVTIGFANGTPGRGDNKQFWFNVSQYDAVNLNGSGDSDKLYFSAIAPSIEGSYTLIADVLEGNGGGNLDWGSGEIQLNIQYINLDGPVLQNLTTNSNLIEFGEQVQISIDSIDESTSVSSVLIEFNGINHTMLNLAGSTYNYSWIPDFVGDLPFYIYALDTENYASIRSGSIVIQDTILPSILEFNRTAETATKGEPFIFTIKVEDQAGIYQVLFEIDSINNSMTFIGDGTWQYEWVPSASGSIQYIIHIQDGNGNWVSNPNTILTTRIPINIVEFLTNPIFLSIGIALVTVGIILSVRYLWKQRIKKKILKDPVLKNRKLLGIKLKEYAENDLIKECANCTMCRDECPTYYSREAESYYAGGRLRVLRAYAEKNFPVDDAFIEAMYFCTTCKQCEDRCPVPVNYVDILEELRSNLVKLGVGPYGKQLGMAKAVHANKNPFNEPFESRKDWCLDEEKNVLDGIKELERGEIAYFVGCTASFRTKDAAMNTARILSKLSDGIVLLGSGEYCCGSPLIRTGQEDFDLKLNEDETVRFRIKDLITHNVESMIVKDIKEVVYSCSGCYKTSMDDWPRYYEKEIPFKRTHITQFLARKIREGTITFQGLKKKITYHDPCHLGRHSNEYDAPREVLKAIPGVELIEMKYNRNRSRCCGSGAGVKAGYPKDALNIAKIRLQEAIDTGADILATSCVFCKFAFIDARKDMGVDIEIANVEDLVVNLLD